MANRQMVLFVKFKSALGDEEVMRVANERIDDFRAIDGLRQKYYFKDPATGEFGGIYIWESPEDLAEYRESELAKSIAAAYEVIGNPKIEVLSVLEALR